MVRTLRDSFLSVSLVALVSGGVGCDAQPLPEPAPNPAYEDLGPLVTSVEGYAFDPEAYFLTFMACGEECPFPPLVMFFYPLVSYASVGEAEVQAFDPLSQQGVGEPGLSGPGGSWRTVVAAREEAPYYLLAKGGVLPTEVDPEIPLPAPPPTEFVPTVTLNPIPTHLSNVCVGIEANLVSRTGALEAVALHLTAMGEPTTVDDLLDPARFGGVIVNWLFSPGGPDGPAVRVPAFGFGIVAEPGRVLPIEWVPDEVELPPEVAALRTGRGFMVGDPSVPMSSIGLSVILLPPGEAGNTVRVTAALPPAEDPEGTPPFEELQREVVVTPGVVQYLPLQLREFGEPPPWTLGLPMLCAQ